MATKVKTSKTSTKKAVKEVTSAAKAIKEAEAKVPVSIKRLIKRVDEIQKQEKALETEKNALKDKIKEFMKENNLGEIVTDDLKALLSFSQRTTFDKENFEKDHPKMYKEYLNYQVKSDKVIESLKVDGAKKTQRRAK